MSEVAFTRATARGDRRCAAACGRLRGGGAGVGEDHRAGGVLPAAGGGRSRSAADSRDHVHGEGRRQHAEEAGARLSRTRRRCGRRWSAPGSRRCTGFARGCCGRTRCSRAWIPEFHVARRARVVAHAAGGDGGGDGVAVPRAAGGGAGADSRALVDRLRGGGALGLRRDARRGLARGSELAAMPAPRRRRDWRDVAATVAALRREPLRMWNAAQREQCEGGDRRRGADRVGARMRGRRWTAIAAFECNLQKCKRGNAAYDLLKQLRDADRRGAVRADHGALRAAAASCCSRSCGGSTSSIASAKRQAGVLDFSDLEEFTVRLLEEHAGDAGAAAGAVRPHPDGRVSGHERAAGEAAAS